MADDNRRYYEAYDERYKTIHGMGSSWFGDEPTSVVEKTAIKYGIAKSVPVLEIGCGEGRDSVYLLEKGYDLTASDVSPEAIRYCKSKYPQFTDSFKCFDCLDCKTAQKYSFIYSVAVIHMLVDAKDRMDFYRFISEHLTCDGIALVCSMGDGNLIINTDSEKAFEPALRNSPVGKIQVASTTCKTVSFECFEEEIIASGAKIIESGFTETKEYGTMMYAVIGKNENTKIETPSGGKI